MTKIEYVNGQPQFPTVPVRIVCEAGVNVPGYQTPGASGFDLEASHETTIEPGSWTLVKTGIRVAVPYGFELQVRSRSGLAAKHGIQVLNSPGTVDADYRGGIGVILFNHGKAPFGIKPGDRIAQAVICPVVQAQFKEVQDLDATSRGEGGFGSTGV